MHTGSACCYQNIENKIYVGYEENVEKRSEAASRQTKMTYQRLIESQEFI